MAEEDHWLQGLYSTVTASRLEVLKENFEGEGITGKEIFLMCKAAGVIFSCAIFLFR